MNIKYEPLHITVESWGSAVSLLSLAGYVDVWTAPELKQVLIDLHGQGIHRLVVDLNGLDFIHATGMGVLLGAHKRALVQGGAVELVCRRDEFLELLEIGGLTAVFRIYGSPEDARAQLGLA
ncbi:hypothetical protein GCM10009566_42460 [Streptomyces murinus]|uniref:Anti-sigma factor antagonist n=1 Tax=Streptomyces murinus TaxID=33900 RepID=A0A7W3NHV9_STRMR|nr:STAS domain-containing protein [Streptomyces murinus]MBA9050855.1 anti-sigma B factor antagonist [Streptomyces murinus]